MKWRCSGGWSVDLQRAFLFVQVRHVATRLLPLCNGSTPLILQLQGLVSLAEPGRGSRAVRADLECIFEPDKQVLRGLLAATFSHQLLMSRLTQKKTPKAGFDIERINIERALEVRVKTKVFFFTPPLRPLSLLSPQDAHLLC